MTFKTRLFCCAGIAGVLNGCVLPLYNSCSIQGKWYLQGYEKTHSILFKRNKRFEYDYNGDGKRDIWGSYEILFDRLIRFTDAKDEMETLWVHHGFHHYSVVGRELQFAFYADQCLPRKMTLDSTWSKINED